MRQEGEPSVDQILQSIRRVMARERRPVSEKMVTDEVATAEPVAELRSYEAEAEETGGQMLPPAEADELMGDPDGERFAEVEALAIEGTTEQEPPSAPLTSEEAADSMRRSLAALATLAQPGAPLPTSAAGAASLDAIVKDMLRPMLAQWLDTHLPALVEREVKAEIARITRG